MLKIVLVIALLLINAWDARADAVSDWNKSANGLLIESQVGPAPANRTLALMNTAIFEAVNAITRKYPLHTLDLAPYPDASIEAAVAAAAHEVLNKSLPSRKQSIDSLYAAALTGVQDEAAKGKGIDLGTKAAQGILSRRADDTPWIWPEAYRPRTSPGTYVPTASVAAYNWIQRKPWIMSSASQFRPGPPPDLKSPQWAADFNEVKLVGVKQSKQRTTEQTASAMYWDSTMPEVYSSIAVSLVEGSKREITRNARLFAALTQGVDDASIAMFDAKYAYNFWRPITAIRNGDMDDNEQTERDPAWLPLIDTPMHPEYPCAHCVIAATFSAILRSDLESDKPESFVSTNYSPKGVRRSWTSLESFESEVANARVWAGVHFRNSTRVGSELGKKIGILVSTHFGLQNQ